MATTINSGRYIICCVFRHLLRHARKLAFAPSLPSVLFCSFIFSFAYQVEQSLCLGPQYVPCLEVFIALPRTHPCFEKLFMFTTLRVVLCLCCVREYVSVLVCLKSGDSPPSNPTLCSYKRLVIGLKAPAFAALKAVSESEEKGVDIGCLSKSLLDCDAVLKFPPGREFEQSLLIHILARYHIYFAVEAPQPFLNRLLCPTSSLLFHALGKV